MDSPSHNARSTEPPPVQRQCRQSRPALSGWSLGDQILFAFPSVQRIPFGGVPLRSARITVADAQSQLANAVGSPATSDGALAWRRDVTSELIDSYRLSGTLMDKSQEIVRANIFARARGLGMRLARHASGSWNWQS